jgi:hypothetical protein
LTQHFILSCGLFEGITIDAMRTDFSWNSNWCKTNVPSGCQSGGACAQFMWQPGHRMSWLVFYGSYWCPFNQATTASFPIVSSSLSSSCVMLHSRS